MYFLPSSVYIYFANQHLCIGFYFSAIVAASFLLFIKWSNLMVFFDNIFVSYIIQGYSSLWRPFNTTYLSWYFFNVTIACLVTINIMRVILWCIFHNGCIDDILQSLNIAFITADIISTTKTIHYQWYDFYLLYHQKLDYHEWFQTIWCICLISL